MIRRQLHALSAAVMILMATLADPASAIRISGKITGFGQQTLSLATVRFVCGADTVETLTDSDGYYELTLDIRTDVTDTARPTVFRFDQNYPNPFNPSTVIGYSLPRSCQVTLDIFSINGQKIRTLVNAREEAGFHAVRWDGRDSRGAGTAAGIYLYRIRAGEFSASRKMMLVDGFVPPMSGKRSYAPANEENSAGKFCFLEIRKRGYQSRWELYSIEPDREQTIIGDFCLTRSSLEVIRINHHSFRFSPGDVLYASIKGIDTPPAGQIQSYSITTTSGDFEQVTMRGYGNTVPASFDSSYSMFMPMEDTSIPYPINPYFMGEACPTEEGLPIPGDGILQVRADIDTVQVTYQPQDGANLLQHSFAVLDYSLFRREMVRDTEYEYAFGNWRILTHADWSYMIQNSFYVSFNFGTPQESISLLHDRLGVTVLIEHPVNGVQVQIPDGSDLIDIMKAYAAEDIVRIVSPISVLDCD